MLYPRKCFGVLQMYICLAVLYNSFAFSFSYPFFCLLFFLCIRDSLDSLSQSFIMFSTQNSESPCSRNLQSLQLTSAVIVTRPETGVEQGGALDSASSKGSDKPVV